VRSPTLAPRGKLARLATILSLAVPVLAPVAAGPVLAGPVRQYVRARLSLGYDNNLLDASNSERAAFDRGDPNWYFAVNSMDDMFLDGELGAQWRLAHGGARPTLGLRFERKQYLRNPIASQNRFTIGSNLHPFSGTRIDLSLEYSPQTYARHRVDIYALPGQPQFRSEVYRRTATNVQITQFLTKATTVGLGAEGSFRDDRPPFDARDRWLGGANVGLSQAFPAQLWVQAVGGFRRTWSRNDPALPTDLSNREWYIRPAIGGNLEPIQSSFKIEVELARRDYLSADPADHSHFGRQDHRGELVVDLTRAIGGRVASETRFTRRWWSSNIPAAAQDDDSFDDMELRSGLVWNWDRAKRHEP
jgi:hypothetical protein